MLAHQIHNMQWKTTHGSFIKEINFRFSAFQDKKGDNIKEEKFNFSSLFLWPESIVLKEFEAKIKNRNNWTYELKFPHVVRSLQHTPLLFVLQATHSTLPYSEQPYSYAALKSNLIFCPTLNKNSLHYDL